MTDLSKLVFDTANSLNKTYLEGMKQGQKMEVKKMQLQELLNRAVNVADDTGQFQAQLIGEIIKFVANRKATSPGEKTVLKDWLDFAQLLTDEFQEVE